MRKVPLLRMRPVILSLIVMVLLALAWLPTGEFLPGDRTNKPQLFVSYEVPTAVANLEDIAFDVRQRIEQRHEWRLVESVENYAWQLHVEVTQDRQIVIAGRLVAPQQATDSAQQNVQHFKIQGPSDAVGALPAQFVKVLIDLIENAESRS